MLWGVTVRVARPEDRFALCGAAVERLHQRVAAAVRQARRSGDGTVTRGGYSTHVVVDKDFVVRIPDALALDGRSNRPASPSAK